jgi:hypothetical protein
MWEDSIRQERSVWNVDIDTWQVEELAQLATQSYTAIGVMAVHASDKDIRDRRLANEIHTLMRAAPRVHRPRTLFDADRTKIIDRECAGHAWEANTEHLALPRNNFRCADRADRSVQEAEGARGKEGQQTAGQTEFEYGGHVPRDRYGIENAGDEDHLEAEFAFEEQRSGTR